MNKSVLVFKKPTTPSKPQRCTQSQEASLCRAPVNSGHRTAGRWAGSTDTHRASPCLSHRTSLLRLTALWGSWVGAGCTPRTHRPPVARRVQETVLFCPGGTPPPVSEEGGRGLGPQQASVTPALLNLSSPSERTKE